jgi:peroxiredoxin
VACLAVNDRFVMQAWIAEHDIGDEFVMLADGDGSFTRALGLDIEIPHMGLRCARGLLLVDDGRIESVHIEKPLALDVSTADACLALL